MYCSSLSPLWGQPYLTHPAATRKSQLLVGKTGIGTMHKVHNLWVSTLNFQLLAEVNGPAKAADSKINYSESPLAVLIDLEVALSSTKFQVIKRNRNCAL